MSPERRAGVAPVPRECFLSVSRALPECPRSICRASPECAPSVSHLRRTRVASQVKWRRCLGSLLRYHEQAIADVQGSVRVGRATPTLLLTTTGVCEINAHSYNRVPLGVPPAPPFTKLTLLAGWLQRVRKKRPLLFAAVGASVQHCFGGSGGVRR